MPATRIPPQPSHTENPTHIETRKHDQCGDTIEKSQAPDDGCILCPKHVENRRSEIKLNKWWHQVGLLLFNYHNDTRSNMHNTFSHLPFNARQPFCVDIGRDNETDMGCQDTENSFLY